MRSTKQIAPIRHAHASLVSGGKTDNASMSKNECAKKKAKTAEPAPEADTEPSTSEVMPVPTASMRLKAAYATIARADKDKKAAVTELKKLADKHYNDLTKKEFATLATRLRDM